MNRWKRRRKSRGTKIKASKVVYQKNVPSRRPVVFDLETCPPAHMGMVGIDFADLERRIASTWFDEVSSLTHDRWPLKYSMGARTMTNQLGPDEKPVPINASAFLTQSLNAERAMRNVADELMAKFGASYISQDELFFPSLPKDDAPEK